MKDILQCKAFISSVHFNAGDEVFSETMID